MAIVQLCFIVQCLAQILSSCHGCVAFYGGEKESANDVTMTQIRLYNLFMFTEYSWTVKKIQRTFSSCRPTLCPTLYSSLVAFRGTVYHICMIFLSTWVPLFTGSTQAMCIVNFSTSNYKLSHSLIILSFFGRKLSRICLVILLWQSMSGLLRATLHTRL